MAYTSSSALHWSELGPTKAALMLLEVEFAGQTFRWSTQPVNVDTAAGEVLEFGGGLNALEFSEVLQTLADTPDQSSISLDVLWPADVALLISQGHDLSAGRGSLSIWLLGSQYDDRQVLVEGRVRQPVYGGLIDPVSFTLEEAPFEDVGQWPSTSARVNLITWPTHQEADAGLAYPQVIHAPGAFVREGGTTADRVGTRALVVETDLVDPTQATVLLIAGHRVRSDTVLIKYVGADGWTPDEGFIDFAPGSGTPDYNGPVETVSDGLGLQCATVDLTGLIIPEIARSQEFQVLWIGAGADVNGGIVHDSETFAIQGAGDVMAFVLQRSTLRIDWGRFEAARARMNAYLIDGYLNDVVKPWDWIVDNLLPLLPVSIHSGPRGVYPVFWRWNAVAADAVERIVWGPGIVRTTGVEYERAPDEISNRITLEYAWDIVENAYQRRVIHTPTPDADDVEQVTSEYAKRSALRYGVTAETTYQSDVITDDTTAHQVVNWRIVAEGFSHRSVTYETPQAYAHLRLGDVVLLTDSELHMADVVALVQGLDLTDTGRIRLVLQLVENVVRSNKTTGPNPDDGAPDPGDYGQ